ncbi:MAG: PD40 domain-containing protein [Elusimicrobia bacterium]|nr:PD40 domain-containing protein [Elusimicrobiota bacterium]
MLKKLLGAAALVAILAALILPIRLEREPESDLYVEPEPVEIAGYDGVAMEPFLSPDGRFLFFNNSNEPKVDTNLHFAERTGPLSFKYLGELPGANSKELDAVPSMDAAGHFFFTSAREYLRTLKSTFTGDFDGKRVAGVRPAPGEIWPRRLGAINMDVGVSPDGGTLYISRAVFLPPLPLPPIGSDLLVARLKDGAWKVAPDSAVIMKNVNTRALEYAPAISPDGLELYFTRASIPGGMRIMVATRPAQGLPFGEPRVLRALTGFVEAPTVSTDLRELFFHKKVDGKCVIHRARRNGAL